MARHRHQVGTLTVVAAALVFFVTGAFFQWAVGLAADKVFDTVTDDGPLAVDVDGAFEARSALPKSNLPDLPSVDEFESPRQLTRIARASGGAAIEPGTVLNVYGLVQTPVILRSIEAVEISCESIDASNWAAVIVEGGGALGYNTLNVELTLSSDTAAGEPGEDPEQRPWTFPRQVSGAEADGFVVFVKAPPDHVCSYKLRVSYTSRGEPGQLVVLNGGSRFWVAALQDEDPDVVY